jgi:L-iditol 2-dehydrogenase
MIPKTMHAAVLHAASDLRYEQVPLPNPAADEVLVRMRANGLCGSDIHFYEAGRLGPYVVDRPYIPGHEASGVIARSSAARPDLKEGQRVVIEPGRPCMRCELCKRGRYNLCREVVFMSAPPVNGTLAEYAAVKADYVFPVPDSLNDEEAAFAEPVSVAIQACRRAGLQAAATVAIIGAGPIGLVTFLVASAFGAGRTILIDMQPRRLELAERLGAGVVIDAARGDPVAALMAATAGRGADYVFDTAGSSAACALTPKLAARGGVVTIVGWPETDTVAFPMNEVLEKELDVRGVNRYCNTFPAAIELLAAGRLDVKPLISHRFPFAESVKAFDFALHHRAETMKVMVLN